MRFEVEQRFRSPLDAVVRALADPDTLLELPDLPKLSRPEVLDARESDGIVRLALRYGFQGELSSAVRAVVDPARLTWVERSEHDLAAGTGTFVLAPDHYADRLRCSGSFRCASHGSGSERRLEGELTVRAPLVAGKVERAIVGGLKEHLELQAALLDDHLTGTG